MIRVAILDPQPAVRAGLDAILHDQPGLVPVGAAADRGALWPLLYRTDPDVVLLGPARTVEGLRLCLQVRARLPGPRVVVYASDAGLDTIVPAAFAGAHAVVGKSAPIGELLHALRSAEPIRAPLTPGLQRRAAARLAPVDRAILAMRLAGTSAHEIAATAGLARDALTARNAAILGALSASAVPVRALDGARELHA